LLDASVHGAVLRPTWFLDNFTTGSFASMIDSGELRLPAGTGRIPFIDTRNIAEVAHEQHKPAPDPQPPAESGFSLLLPIVTRSVGSRVVRGRHSGLH
jgi:uncharacterized protein YbjT (DUF2867 family)